MNEITCPKCKTVFDKIPNGSYCDINHINEKIEMKIRLCPNCLKTYIDEIIERIMKTWCRYKNV